MTEGKQRSSFWFWLVLALAVAGLTLIFTSRAFRSLLEAVTVWAKDYISANPTKGALIFFLFSVFSAMLAFLSSAVLVPAANLVWGRLITFFLLWGGWLTGGMIAFCVGRLARPLLIRLGYGEKLAKYQEYVSRRTRFWMVLLFCFAVPSEIPGYVMGGAHYRFWKFIAAIAVSEGFYAFALVLAGDTLIGAKRIQMIIIIAAVIFTFLAARMLFRKFRKRREQQPRI